MVQAPLIGVVADHKFIEASDHSVNAPVFVGAFATYLRCLVGVGALPVIIPLELPDEALRGIYEHLDGILFTGGGDVDPAIYGVTEIHETVRIIKPERDHAELLISRWAAADDTPLLGICRGHQVINVALGGTLIMDIPSQAPSDIQHDTPDDQPLSTYVHEVQVDPDSLLAQALGTHRLPTNSRHHQAVDRVGEGLIVTARSADGLIEATEKPDARFFVTVQWHPENLCPDDAAMRGLFRTLAEAAIAHHQHRLNHLIVP